MAVRDFSFFFITEYRETVDLGLQANASNIAKPVKFFSIQEKNPILNGRPLNNSGITLYNIFNKFLENICNEEISSDTLQL
jgi:hypothetical protein